jgi:predicted O-linked N-acetylglucosamine transferase (SPINDLY family)
MLRSVGLEELIAKSADEYTRLTLKLIHDERYRLKTQDKLKQVDLNKTIFNADSKKYFRKAIDFLIENHEQLKREKSRKPLIISH